MDWVAVEMAGMVAVWVVVLVEVMVRVPGPLPVRRMEHSEPAGRIAVQVVARVKPVAVRFRPVASADPRLRRVMMGAVSIEKAREGALVVERRAR